MKESNIKQISTYSQNQTPMAYNFFQAQYFSTRYLGALNNECAIWL